MGKKSRILCAAVALTMGLSFAGCGGTNEEPPVTPPEEPAKLNYYLRTDKEIYCNGEEVFFTVGGGHWVGVYGKDDTVSVSSAAVKYQLDDYAISSGTHYSTSVEGNLETGEYRAILFGDESAEDIKAEASFEVVEHALFSDKDEYFSDEQIVVTAYGGDDAWVGLYAAEDNPQNTTSICWYYLQKDTHLVGQSYIMQRTGIYNKYDKNSLPAGEYKLVLFENGSQSSAVKEKNITIKSGKVGKPSAPLSAEYVLDNPENGKASGSLSLTFGADNGFASEVVAYWADGDGALEDYLPFAPVKVSGKVINYDVLENVYIPEKAEKIRFYGKNNTGLSEDYLDVDIPARARDFGKKTYTYNVVSDIHVSTLIGGPHNGKELYNTHLEEACLDMAEVSPKSEGMFIVGDIANSGRAEEWKKASDIIDSVVGAPLPYYVLGNHDLYDNTTPYDKKVQNFLNYSGQEKAYYEVEIKGFHHLILGSQAQHTDGGVHSFLFDDQLNWLDERLADITAKKDAPVFVYSHQSLYNTIAGSLKGQNWNGIEQNDKLQAILAKYPNVILFNGHSHWIMQSYRNAYFSTNKMSNAFNTSSVAYLWSTTDTEIEVAGSQGYYVDIYKEAVVIRGRDFTTKKWIPSACYIVDRMD